MRVLITGMGGQLGTLVARRLERLDGVEAIAGIDLDPPRRRMHRAEFHWMRPGDVDTIDRVVRSLDPTVVLHLAQYEPHARLAPGLADKASRRMTRSLLQALDDAPSLRTIVVRSGIEVYGRGRGGVICPDESVAPEPTSGFGRRLFATEEAVAEFVAAREGRGGRAEGEGLDGAGGGEGPARGGAGAGAGGAERRGAGAGKGRGAGGGEGRGGASPGVRVTALRFAPIAGYHTPNPLARLLKMAVVPVPALAEPTFSLTHAADAAEAVVAAATATAGFDGPVNVVGDGAVSALQAARMGGRVPVPILGPGWLAASRLTEFAGSPLPDHVRELLTRGRTADGGRCRDALGVAPSRSTRDVVTEIHEQSGVEFLEVVDGYAA